MAALGAVSSYAGTKETGQAQSDAALYQAQVASNNARVADQNAQYATEAGEAQGEASSMKGAAKSAAVKSSIAANGVNVNTGSAVNVQKSENETNALDTANVVQNANLQAYGYRTQAASFENQANLDDMEASNATKGADISALGGLLGSASSIGFKYSMPTGGGGQSIGNSP